MSIAFGARSSTSRYSGKVSQSNLTPSASTVPGMSSTPSIRLISAGAVPGRTGAKPTPQLPITAVVTPCQDDGRQERVPGGLAVVVRVDVDEAGRDQQAAGVDLAPALADVVAHRGDGVAVDGDVGLAARRAGAVDDGAAADHEIVHGPELLRIPRRVLPGHRARLRPPCAIRPWRAGRECDRT